MGHKKAELAPADLLLLQKHIKLGKKHLESCLSQKEIDLIFDLVKLPQKTEQNLSTNKLEMAGHVSLVLNTILTGVFGFWLGLSALLELELASKPLFISLLIFSFAVGGAIGLQSILFRRRIAGDILDRRKLQDFELQLVKKVNQNRKKEIQNLISELASILSELKIEVHKEALEETQLDVQIQCLEWISQIRASRTDDLSFIRSFLEEKIQSRALYDSNTKGFKKIAQKLSHSSMHPSVGFKVWVQSNLSRLIVELIPTLFGGAASLFVYIGGAHSLTEEMGNKAWLQFLERPEVKAVELIFVGIVVLYFLFSFLYMNQKAFKRDKEIAKFEMELIREEKRMHQLDDQLLKIKEALRIMERVRLMVRQA